MKIFTASAINRRPSRYTHFRLIADQSNTPEIESLKREWNVGIVGGGPGGLMAAYFLQSAANVPIRLTIYEASDRLGGKVISPRFTTLPIGYEAGAAEFYDYSAVGEDPLKELIVEELGLSIRPIGGSALLIDRQVLSTLDDFRDHFGPASYQALLAFDRAAKDSMSPREFYASDNTEAPGILPSEESFDRHLAKIVPEGTRRYIERLIHSDLATEPERTSLSYGLQNYLMNDPRYLRQYRIIGGNQQFPAELARRIEATWRMNHTVGAIGRGADGKLEVTSRHLDVERQESFDFVIVALPNNYLPGIHFRGEALAAAMQSHHAHYDHPAHYLRITILFERPFWRSKLDEAYWMLDAFGGCCLYDESSLDPEAMQGVLGWLLGGDAAEALSSCDDAALIERALASLPKSLAEGHGLFLEGQVFRWVNAVNALPGGRSSRSLDRRHQPEPVGHPDLFAVGDYMFDSTLNGLLDSAEYVAYWLAAQTIES